MDRLAERIIFCVGGQCVSLEQKCFDDGDRYWCRNWLSEKLCDDTEDLTDIVWSSQWHHLFVGRLENRPLCRSWWCLKIDHSCVFLFSLTKIWLMTFVMTYEGKMTKITFGFCYTLSLFHWFLIFLISWMFSCHTLNEWGRHIIYGADYHRALPIPNIYTHVVRLLRPWTVSTKQSILIMKSYANGKDVWDDIEVSRLNLISPSPSTNWPIFIPILTITHFNFTSALPAVLLLYIVGESESCAVQIYDWYR